MKVTVLKPFPFAADGIHIRDLVTGAEEDIHDDLVPGLVAEGFVVGKEPDEPAEFPPDGGPVAVGVEGGQPDADGTNEPASPADDAYPDLSPAQEAALDRDGDGAPGGSLPKAKQAPVKVTPKKKSR